MLLGSTSRGDSGGAKKEQCEAAMAEGASRKGGALRVVRWLEFLKQPENQAVKEAVKEHVHCASFHDEDEAGYEPPPRCVATLRAQTEKDNLGKELLTDRYRVEFWESMATKVRARVRVSPNP